jgi:uncharacterized membrane protein YbhN (UPF0104 family)
MRTAKATFGRWRRAFSGLHLDGAWSSRRLRLFGLVAIGTAAVVLVAGPEEMVSSLDTTFANVQWLWLALAIGLNLVSVSAGSLAWWTVINESMAAPRPAYRDVFSAFSIGLLANAILPGRAGELARVAVLTRRTRRRNGIWATLAGTVVAFRLLDLVPSLALAGFVLTTVAIPRWALVSIGAVAVIGGASLLLGIAFARRHERTSLDTVGRVRRLVDMGRQGLGILHAPLPAATAVLHQCLAWSAQLLAVWATMRAFHIVLPLSCAAVVLVLVNVAILFPLWPGNVGLLQVAVAVPLGWYGVAYANGLAFGIGLQATETAVGVTLGLVCLAREGLSVAALKEIPATAAGES